MREKAGHGSPHKGLEPNQRRLAFTGTVVFDAMLMGFCVVLVHVGATEMAAAASAAAVGVAVLAARQLIAIVTDPTGDDDESDDERQDGTDGALEDDDRKSVTDVDGGTAAGDDQPMATSGDSVDGPRSDAPPIPRMTIEGPSSGHRSLWAIQPGSRL